MFFLLLSAYGFAGVFVCGKATWPHYLAAYLGAGMALATKGVPALAMIGSAWVFAALFSRHRLLLRWPVHAVTLIAGLALGSAWYVLMFVIHGPVAIDLFLADQVGARITPDLVRPPIQFPVVLAVFAAFLLP